MRRLAARVAVSFAATLPLLKNSVTELPIASTKR